MELAKAVKHLATAEATSAFWPHLGRLGWQRRLAQVAHMQPLVVRRELCHTAVGLLASKRCDRRSDRARHLHYFFPPLYDMPQPTRNKKK